MNNSKNKKIINKKSVIDIKTNYDVQDIEPDLEVVLEVKSEDDNVSSDSSDYKENNSNNNFESYELQNKLRNLRNNRSDENNLEELKRDRTIENNNNEENDSDLDNNNPIDENPDSEKSDVSNNKTNNEGNELPNKGNQLIKKFVRKKGSDLIKNGGKAAAEGTKLAGTAAAGAESTAVVAGTTAAEGAAATGLAALAANPYFWIVVGAVLIILILLIFIVVIWAAYGGSSNNSENEILYNSNGSCNYVLNGAEIKNLKVRLLTCDGSKPIEGEELVDFEKYVMGVTYAENGGGPAEALKAQAIAAKSYALRRPDKMGNNPVKFTEENGQKILNIRNCTNDQVYCDPDKGCWSESSSAGNTVYSGYQSNKAWKKPALAENSDIRTAVNDVKDKILVESSGNIYSSGYMQPEQDKWNSGANSGKTYVELLKLTYSDATISTISCNYEDLTVGGNCVTATPIKISSNEKFNITSSFGYRKAPTAGASSNHKGVDLGVVTGTPIYSVFDGEVTVSQDGYGSAGKAIVIGHDLDGDNKFDYYTEYFHLSKRLVKKGNKVTGGQQIAESGNTGASTGPHLHFGLLKGTSYIDPEPVLNNLRNKKSVFDKASVCENRSTLGTSQSNFVSNNEGSKSGGKSNTCNGNTKTTTQPDPANAINYWDSKKAIKKENFIYPKEKSSGYSLGAHPKNFKYESLTNMKNYSRIFAWPVTPENNKYTFVYEHNGIDILAPMGTPIYAPVSGKLVYSEWGHTVNKNCNETAYSVKIKLDKPFSYDGVNVNYIFMTHMIGIIGYCPSSSCNRNIKQGTLVGFVGWANANHLHMTFCKDSNCNSGLKTSQIEKVYNIKSGTIRKAGE